MYIYIYVANEPHLASFLMDRSLVNPFIAMTMYGCYS